MIVPENVLSQQTNPKRRRSRASAFLLIVWWSVAGLVGAVLMAIYVRPSTASGVGVGKAATRETTAAVRSAATATRSSFPVVPVGAREPPRGRGKVPTAPFLNGRLSFTIDVGGVGKTSHRSDYDRLALFVLPGEGLDFAPKAWRPGERASITGPSATGRIDLAGEALPVSEPKFALTAKGGDVEVSGQGRWRWQAGAVPSPTSVKIERLDTGEVMNLVVFVMVPASSVTGGKLNGYRIDDYPAEALRGNPIYLPPQGFVELTAANLDTRVSPHFTLRQFVCKQASGYPKYLILESALLLKLELLLELVNAADIRTDSFAVLSAFRTPFYNREIRNTLYSRHQWGDAADIFIDVDGNGWMDDLDGSGAVDLADADVLYRFIEHLSDQPWYRPFEGGLGLYAPSPSRGPFVHVDVRGSKARWTA